MIGSATVNCYFLILNHPKPKSRHGLKQILQNMGSGETSLITAPAPKAATKHLLINTATSLVSVGTERMLVEFGKASYLDKARQQPEKVKMVLDKVKTDGLATTIDAVKSKLEQPLPLGYCNVGLVHDLGAGCDGFQIGDRVVSNGPHADVVNVPQNLCAKVPDSVSDEEAAFTVIGSIGLQGIRLVQPTLGECIVVTGVGLIGLITVQLLIANGCRVLAIDFDQSKLDLAKIFGAEVCNPGKGEDPVAAGMAFSNGKGVDAVIITASTKSSDPVSQAAQMSRKRGRIVLVGVVGLELNRSEFYEKELSFQVSCSYGPGRYDPTYEEQGNDYPLGFVRWTEQRNFEAILDMMARGRIDAKPLISHRFEFEQAEAAYDLLTSEQPALGILLEYNSEINERHVSTVELVPNSPSFKVNPGPRVAFLGAGNYASRVLVPAFKQAKANLVAMASAGGVSSVVHGKKSGFANATTDSQALIKSEDNDTIVIATRHNSHADLVAECLEQGKNVFVEKPLAINREQLNLVEEAYDAAMKRDTAPRLMLGFNRRFSPHVQKMKALLEPVAEPKSFVMTMNAGAIPADHWTQDANVGGGRIIGEACHFIDLMRFLAGSNIISVSAQAMGHAKGIEVTEDKAMITLAFEDGSIGVIHYLANGHSSFPKERIEVFAAGRVLQLDNFRKLTGFGWPGFKKMRTWKQEKGQAQCAAAFMEALENGAESPISYDEIIEVARVTLDAAEQIRSLEG
jgi:predicted dehydrogenase/threonine dehydrogenase-like Zn-dependent dehydrogenase